MIYVLILLLFVDGEVVNGRLVGYPTAEACKASQVEVMAQAKDLVVSATCVPVHKPFVAKKERDS